jgi:hypothetical protein
VRSWSRSCNLAASQVPTWIPPSGRGVYLVLRVEDLSKVLDCSLVRQTHVSILLLLFLLAIFHIWLLELFLFMRFVYKYLLLLVVKYNWLLLLFIPWTICTYSRHKHLVLITMRWVKVSSSVSSHALYSIAPSIWSWASVRDSGRTTSDGRTRVTFFWVVSQKCFIELASFNVGTYSRSYESRIRKVRRWVTNNESDTWWMTWKIKFTSCAPSREPRIYLCFHLLGL